MCHPNDNGLQQTLASARAAETESRRMGSWMVMP